MILGGDAIASEPLGSPGDSFSGEMIAEVPSVIMELLSIAPTPVHSVPLTPVKISFRAGQSLFTSAQRRPTIIENQANTGPDWINLADAITANDTAATVSIAPSQFADFLVLRGFQFPLVDGNVVSTSVEIRAKKSAAVGISFDIVFAKDGSNFNITMDGPPDFSNILTTSFANHTDGCNFTGIVTGPEASSDLFAMAIRASSSSSVVISVDDVLLSITYSSGITIKKTVGIGPFAIEFITVAPATPGGGEMTPFVMEFASLAPTTRHTAAVPAFPMKFTSVIPTTRHTVSVPAFPMEFMLLAPTTLHKAIISPFVMEFVTITPLTPNTLVVGPFELEFRTLIPITATESQITPFILDFLTVSPATAHTFGIEPFVMKFVSLEADTPAMAFVPSVAMGMTGNAPNTSKIASVPSYAFEFFTIAPFAFSGIETGPVIFSFLGLAPATAHTVAVPSIAMEFPIPLLNNATFIPVPPVVVEFIGLDLAFDKIAEVPSVKIAFKGKSPLNFPPIFIGLRSIKGLSSSSIVGVSGVHVLGMD